MIKEQKTTSRNGVFFSVMRGGLLEGKKNTRKEILKMIDSNLLYFAWGKVFANCCSLVSET
ncbi:hypothetical protein Peur_037845 [Populus x canadensis]|jgi:hypothetical protein